MVWSYLFFRHLLDFDWFVGPSTVRASIDGCRPTLMTASGLTTTLIHLHSLTILDGFCPMHFSFLFCASHPPHLPSPPVSPDLFSPTCGPVLLGPVPLHFPSYILLRFVKLDQDTFFIQHRFDVLLGKLALLLPGKVASSFHPWVLRRGRGGG